MDENSFKKHLFDFLENAKKMTKPHYPQLAKKEISLYKLYNQVIQKGGYKIVTEKKQWKEIAQSSDVPPNCTSATYSIRIIYEKFLYEYEQVNFFGKKLNEVETKLLTTSESDIGPTGRKRSIDHLDHAIQYTKKRKNLTEREIEQIRIVECSFEAQDTILINYSLNLINSKAKWFWENISNLEDYLVNQLNDSIHLVFEPNSFFNDIKRSDRNLEQNAFLALLAFLQLSREKLIFSVNSLLPIFSQFYKNNFNEEFKDVMIEILLNCAKQLKPTCEVEAVRDLFIGIQSPPSLESIEILNAFLEDHGEENKEYLIAYVTDKTLKYVEYALDEKRDAFIRETCLAFLLHLGKIEHFKKVVAGQDFVYRLIELMERTYDVFHHQLCGLILLEVHGSINETIVDGISKSLLLLACNKSASLSSILSIVLSSMK
jgi:hypothetical protein